MSSLRVVGFDPSMRNWGIVAGRYDTSTQLFTPSTIRVVQTEKSANKQVRVSHSDLVSATKICEGIKPFVDGCDLIFVEVPVGSKSSAAMKSYGMCLGILGAVNATGKPMFELTPKEVKMAAVGNPEATKSQMIQWAYSKYPHLDWPTKTVKGVVTVVESKAEHMADAISAIHAGLQSDQFRKLAAIKL